MIKRKTLAACVLGAAFAVGGAAPAFANPVETVEGVAANLPVNPTKTAPFKVVKSVAGKTPVAAVPLRGKKDADLPVPIVGAIAGGLTSQLPVQPPVPFRATNTGLPVDAPALPQVGDLAANNLPFIVPSVVGARVIPTDASQVPALAAGLPVAPALLRPSAADMRILPVEGPMDALPVNPAEVAGGVLGSFVGNVPGPLRQIGAGDTALDPTSVPAAVAGKLPVVGGLIPGAQQPAAAEEQMTTETSEATQTAGRKPAGGLPIVGDLPGGLPIVGGLAQGGLPIVGSLPVPLPVG